MDFFELPSWSTHFCQLTGQSFHRQRYWNHGTILIGKGQLSKLHICELSQIENNRPSRGPYSCNSNDWIGQQWRPECLNGL
jgi:hypothetical protein